MSDEGPPYELWVSRIPWDPLKEAPDQSDYLLGILIDTPEMFMVLPNEQIALVYIYRKGIARIFHDFSALDDDQRSILISHLRKDLT